MGWHESLYAKLKARGHQSVVDYLRTEPYAKFEALAKTLGQGVLGQQLILAAAAEASALPETEVDHYLKENFVRWFHIWRPTGWGRGELVEFRQTAVVVDSVETAGVSHKQLAERFGRQVRQARPSDDWMPAGPDDEILSRALDAAKAGAPQGPRVYGVTRTHPWGDYGSALVHGFAERSADGVLGVSRCGPATPPAFLPSGVDSALVVRDELRGELSQRFATLSFRAVEKRHIAAVPWGGWDLQSARPPVMPEGGEPFNYVHANAHSPDAAERMGALWEVVAPPLDRDAREGDASRALFTQPGKVGIYAGAELAQWLSARAGDWLVYEELLLDERLRL
jgi:hypothetical protein